MSLTLEVDPVFAHHVCICYGVLSALTEWIGAWST